MRAHFEVAHPESAAILEGAELDSTLPQPMIPFDAPPAVRATAVRALVDADVRAGGQLLKYVGEGIRERVYRLNSGRQIWRKLATEHSAWQQSQGPVFTARLENLCPIDGESITVYCRRVERLQEDLRDVDMAVNQVMLNSKLLDGLVRSRPVWSTAAVAIRATLNSSSTISDVMAGLVRMEREVELLRTPAPSLAMVAAPAGMDQVMSLLTAMRTDLDDVRALAAQAPPRGHEAPGRSVDGSSSCASEQQQQQRQWCLTLARLLRAAFAVGATIFWRDCPFPQSAYQPPDGKPAPQPPPKRAAFFCCCSPICPVQPALRAGVGAFGRT